MMDVPKIFFYMAVKKRADLPIRPIFNAARGHFHPFTVRLGIAEHALGVPQVRGTAGKFTPGVKRRIFTRLSLYAYVL